MPVLLFHPLAVLFRALASLPAALLAPPRCAACDGPAARASVFCPVCAATIRRAPAMGRCGPLEAIVALGFYGGAVEAAVRRLKYSGRPDLGRPLGHLLRRAARDAALTVDLVVPVPLHARRLAERGYNQAALLAAELADELGVPHSARALVRLRDTRQQARCVRAERLINVDGAFAARRPQSLAGRRIALVDDVVTTGATLDACACALRAAGAVSVCAVVLARAERDDDDGRSLPVLRARGALAATASLPFGNRAPPFGRP